MKKILSLLSCAALLIIIAAACGGNKAHDGEVTEKWGVPQYITTAGFDENGINFYSLPAGKTAAGDTVSFVRVPLEGTWMDSEIQSARLFLKLKQGAAPKKLKVGPAVSAAWSEATEQEQAMTDIYRFSLLDTRQEKDGWLSVDVTAYVKTWLSGEQRNNGFALVGDDGGELCVFFGAEDEKSPYLEVSGKLGEREKYGRFAFTKWPLENTDEAEGGNCMAYALRDTNSILAEDLGLDESGLNRSYIEAGEDGVLEYTAKLVEAYIAAHGEGLKISGFRRIGGFDSEIDSDTEYRIALRVGCKVFDGVVDLGGRSNFDYHFWAQLDSGQWTQKFALDPSVIVPESGPGISPEKHSWDSALLWIGKFRDYYTSKTVFYAVTKDTDLFTEHKGPGEKA